MGNLFPKEENGVGPMEPELVEECVVRQAILVDKWEELSMRVDELMEKRRLFLDSGLTLDMLAQEVGTNRTYLSRMFNMKKQIPYLVYLNRLRLDYALSLFESGVEDVQQIVVESGFVSERTFYRALLQAGDERCNLLKKKYLCLNLFKDMADEKIIFSMNGVGKTLPASNRTILKDIYLSFFYGAKIGIIGLNGSGKSTLMKIIAGIEKS